MRTRHMCIAGAVLALILFPTASRTATEAAPRADKILVNDGHVRHDLADLHNHATNWGLIGSMPGSGAPFATAPSARWPGATGMDHLYSASLWVGARVLGETRVTTGSFDTELLPTDAPADTIQVGYRDMPGGARYPWPGPDDDGDGAEDEDPLNARDDDGDGLVDEDCAGIGQQHYFATMADTAAVLQELHPDHTPLGIEVLQQSFQWSSSYLTGVIGYDFTITNVGATALEDVYCGIFSDFDINGAQDDRAGYLDRLIRAHEGSFVPVRVGYMIDGDVVPEGGWAGWVLCGLDRDPTSQDPEDIISPRGFQIFAGQQPFASGGDPTNDAERYEALSSETWDEDTAVVGDYRILLPVGPVDRLEPGESVTARYALVVGADEDAMLAAAAEAVWTAGGRLFDRDLDPANGDEFVVRWMSADDWTVPTTIPRLRAGSVGGGVQLSCDLRGATGPLAVERRAGTGVPWRRWSGWDGRVELVDADPVGWPRTYDLLHRGADGLEKRVDTVEIAGPPAAGIRLEVGPNPFNPLLNIDYYLPEAANARLTVHSLRGELIRVLHDGPAAAGEGTAVWRGEDQTGRAQASGVYLVRLSTTQRVVEQRVTLVR